jgi:hypothetical protein
MENISSGIRKDFNLQLKEDFFSKEIVYACFEATSSLLAGNVNLQRTRVGVLGLYLIICVSLSLPSLAPTVNAVLLSRREPASDIVSTLLKSLFPLYRNEGSYTVGSEVNFSDLITKLKLLRSAIVADDSELRGSMLSDHNVRKNFRTCVVSELDYLLSAETIGDFVSNSLGSLSNIQKLLAIGSRSFTELEPYFRQADAQSSILGIRKLFRVSEGLIGCGGEIPLVPRLYLYDLIISGTFVTIAGQKLVVNSPTSSSSVVQLTTDNHVERLRRILYDMRLENSGIEGASVPPASTGTGVGGSTPRAGSKPGVREFSSIPSRINILYAKEFEGRLIMFESLDDMVKFNNGFVFKS